MTDKADEIASEVWFTAHGGIAYAEEDAKHLANPHKYHHDRILRARDEEIAYWKAVANREQLILEPLRKAVREMADTFEKCRPYQICDELDKIIDPVLETHSSTIQGCK